MTGRLRIKICCIKSIEEAAMAIRFGADALGLVSSMPSGPGVIHESLIREIAETIPPPVGSFLLTSSRDITGIIRQQRYCRTNTIQICDLLEHGTYDELREALPGIKLVQVLHVEGPDTVEQARRIEAEVDAVLLDSGNPRAPVKELGGTGRIHNWEISRLICESVSCPVFLAGGISSNNVKKALEIVNPYGIDLCSSVRTGDRLDEKKLENFFRHLDI